MYQVERGKGKNWDNYNNIINKIYLKEEKIDTFDYMKIKILFIRNTINRGKEAITK